MKRFFCFLAIALTVYPLAAQQKTIVVMPPYWGGPSIIPELQKAAPEVTFVPGDPKNLVSQASDADAIVGTVTPEVMRSAKKLKWVHVYTAGLENYNFPELINSDVVLTNARIIQGPEISDHALALLLFLTRNLNEVAAHKGDWSFHGKYTAIELRGKTALIVGVGGIGQQIAQRAWAFGMTVVGVDPQEYPYNPYVSQIVKPDRLDSVIPSADVVFVSAPLTPKSEGMIGPRQFELMKKGAYFIVVSRGKLYSTQALITALETHRLAGVGLDVTNPEPLPPDHPLWKFPNIIISPHVATVSDNIQTRHVALIRENVARFVRGEPLINVVQDKSRGY